MLSFCYIRSMFDLMIVRAALCEINSLIKLINLPRRDGRLSFTNAAWVRTT